MSDFFRKWQHSILAHAHRRAYADAHEQGASQLKTSRQLTPLNCRFNEHFYHFNF